MKWCFLVNVALTTDFLGRLSHQIVKEGDDCILLVNSKIAEYTKMQYFPKDVKVLSKVDWCIKNYKKNQKEFRSLSWEKLFPNFEKCSLFKFNYDNSLEIILQLYQFFDFVLRKERPNVVIFEMPGSIFAGIAFHLCRKYNIDYLGLLDSTLPGRTIVYDLERGCSKYEKTFKELNSDNISDSEKKFAREFIKNFLSHQQLPSYVDYQIKYSKTGPIKNYIRREIKMIRPWLQYFLNRKYFRPFDYESEIQLKSWLLNPWRKSLMRRIRLFLQKNIYDSAVENDKFFFFPLQVEPELGTTFLATHFSDQLNTIKNIAFSLPLPYKLYVKEHPLFIGERTTGFYKTLKRIPNVILISPNENVEPLIKKSQGVITLSSTVGMEAALAGKPVYILGDAFYSYHPLCKKVDTFEELKQKIETDLNRKSVPIDLKDINHRFIISYFRNTISGDIATAISENDTNDYKATHEDIKRIFLRKKNGK